MRAAGLEVGHLSTAKRTRLILNLIPEKIAHGPQPPGRRGGHGSQRMGRIVPFSPGEHAPNPRLDGSLPLVLGAAATIFSSSRTAGENRMSR